jgi:hypothetical protein
MSVCTYRRCELLETPEEERERERKERERERKERLRIESWIRKQIGDTVVYEDSRSTQKAFVQFAAAFKSLGKAIESGMPTDLELGERDAIDASLFAGRPGANARGFLDACAEFPNPVVVSRARYSHPIRRFDWKQEARLCRK